jgi:hypothetical protein
MTHSYRLIRESIRTNGIAYTAHIAMEHGDTHALSVIDALINQCIKPTDWLAIRARWIKTERDAIRLTTWVGVWTMTYLHHIAACQALNVKPMHYTQWLNIRAAMGLWAIPWTLKHFGELTMYFATFYQNPINYGQADLSPIEATGDRSVIILDGRETIPTMHDFALSECAKRGYVGFSIHKGDTFTRSTMIRKPYFI